jgi:hypothetical protein
MKKTVCSLILGASLMVSSSALALTAMTDSNMKSATGQAGVSIALDDVTLYQYVGATTYTDTDGLAAINGAGDSAGIKITGAETLTTIRAILDGGNRGGFLTQSYGGLMTDHAGAATTWTSADGNEINVSNNRTGFSAGTTTAIGDIKVAPLTIDVSSKVQALSYGMAYNSAAYIGAVIAAKASVPDTGDVAADTLTAVNLLLTSKNLVMSETEKEVIVKLAVTMQQKIATDTPADIPAYIAANSMGVAMDGVNVAGVVIGLPTIEIVKTGSVKTVSVTGAANSANNDDAFIAIKTGESSLAVLGGYIEICPH